MNTILEKFMEMYEAGYRYKGTVVQSKTDLYFDHLFEELENALEIKKEWDNVNDNGDAMIITRSLWQQLVNYNSKLQKTRPIEKYHVQIHVSEHHRLKIAQQKIHNIEELLRKSENSKDNLNVYEMKKILTEDIKIV